MESQSTERLREILESGDESEWTLTALAIAGEVLSNRDAASTDSTSQISDGRLSSEQWEVESLEGCERILDAINEQLYRTNVFRLTGESVRASYREIRRRTEEIELQLKLGQKPTATAGPLPVDEYPDGQSLRQLTQRLTDPEIRLLHEMFWLWPLDGSDEDTTSYGSESLTEDMHEMWCALTLQAHAAPSSPVAVHNLAVIAHAKALDLEHQHSEGSLTVTEQARLAALWDKSLVSWENVISNGSFWKLAESRVHELNDPRISDNYVAKLRYSLPYALLGINARMAISAAEKNQLSDMTRHSAVISGSPFASDVTSIVLQRELAPLQARLKAFCDATNDGVDSEPAAGVNLCQQLITNSDGLLETYLRLLGEEHTLCVDAHDTIASTGLHALITYCDNTADFPSAVLPLERLGRIAKSPVLQERLQSNAMILSENVAAAQKEQERWGSLEHIHSAPSLGTFNGIGCCLYGREDFDSDSQSYITTLYFTVLFIPLFPISRYRVIDAGNRTYRFLGKLALSQSNKIHLFGVIFAIIAMFMLANLDCGGSRYGSSSGQRSNYSSTSQRRSVSPPSNTTRSRSSAQSRTQSRSSVRQLNTLTVSRLELEISEGRSELRAMENSVEIKTAELDRKELLLKSLAADIEEIERTASYGGTVNETEYENTIEEHNSLVVEYNDLLSEVQRMIAAYEARLNALNVKIDEYNRLIGAE